MFWDLYIRDLDPSADTRSAMSDAGSTGSQCPVLAAWGQSKEVLHRLSAKNVLVLSSDSKLNRNTCAANKALLVPLINLVGNSGAITSPN